MPSVSDCPYCGQRTGIPENLDPEATVRCPLCEFEFSLDHALMNAEEAPPEHIAELPPELIPVPAMGVTDAPPTRADVEPPAETDTSPEAAPAFAAVATETEVVSQGPWETELEPTADALQAGSDDAATETASAFHEPEASLATSVVVADLSSAGEMPVPVSEASAAAEPVDHPGTDPLAEPAESPPAVEEVAAAAELSGAAAVPDATATESVLVSCSAEAAAEPVAETAIQTDQVPGTAVESVDAMGEAVGAMGDPVVVAAPEGISEEAGQAEPDLEEPEEHEEGVHEPFGHGLTGPGIDGAEAAVAVPAWRQQRKAHPIRNLIGLVVSGLLGLAVAYGLLNWLGPTKLKFWKSPRPQAAERENSDSAAKASRSGSESVLPPKLPEIGSGDEFTGLENRTFEAPKNVEPSRTAKPRK
jgi:hypothetical protein